MVGSPRPDGDTADRDCRDRLHRSGRLHGAQWNITISIAVTPGNANSHAIHGATSQAARAAVILGEQPTVTTGNKFNDAANGQVELDEHGAQGPLH
jgi:hypothetical protein